MALIESASTVSSRTKSVAVPPDGGSVGGNLVFESTLHPVMILSCVAHLGACRGGCLPSYLQACLYIQAGTCTANVFSSCRGRTYEHSENPLAGREPLLLCVCTPCLILPGAQSKRM